jgi:protein ImuB
MGSELKEPLYICVYVPEFPAQALLRLRPELSKKPVAVFAGVPPLEEVCSVNKRATRAGVVPGMTRAELESFSDIAALRRSEPEERAARDVLLEAASAFTPRMEIQHSSDASFVFVLDMTGTTLLFGTTHQVIQRIEKDLSKLRFFVQLSASANLHAAICIAPSARKQPIFLPSGQEQQGLRALPLAALNLAEEQAKRFSLWGLHTLGELAALPEVDLISRMGQQGKRLRQLARGELPHLMVPVEPTFTLSEFIAFDAPVELLDSLLFVISPMLNQILARAQNRALAIASLTIKLGLDGGGEHERMIKPALPVAQQDVLLKLLHLDLQAHPPAAGVLSIHATAEPGDRTRVQLGLFSPQLPEPMRLDVTLARIAALVGEGRVGRACLNDTNRSNGFRMERFILAADHGDSEIASRSMALRRFRPPVTLSMQQEGIRPKLFFFEGRRYNVQESFGPWRRSGEWWSAEVWSREEWDVRAVTSSEETLCGVIAHDLLRKRWELEALYD